MSDDDLHQLRQRWASNIRFRRRLLHLNQMALAEQCGVGQQTVSRWENGLSVPDDRARPALARALGTTVYELLPYE